MSKMAGRERSWIAPVGSATARPPPGRGLTVRRRERQGATNPSGAFELAELVMDRSGYLFGWRKAVPLKDWRGVRFDAQSFAPHRLMLGGLTYGEQTSS